MSNPSILLSAFADEAANRKTALEQFSALSAIGLHYYSPRFIDLNSTGEVQHVVDLGPRNWKTLVRLQDEFGLSVTSI